MPYKVGIKKSYLEMGMFNAIFSTEAGERRRRALYKKEKAKKNGLVPPKKEGEAAASASAPAPAPAAAAAAEPEKAAETVPDAAAAASTPAPDASAPAPAVESPAATTTAPAPAPPPAPAPEAATVEEVPDGLLGGLDILGEVVETAPTPAPASNPAPAAAFNPPPAADEMQMAAKGEWNDVKLAKLVELRFLGQSWLLICTTLGEDLEACIEKWSNLDNDTKGKAVMNHPPWPDHCLAELMRLKESEKKSWSYISAALCFSEDDCKSRYAEIKKEQNQNAKGKDKNKDKDKDKENNKKENNKGKKGSKAGSKNGDEEQKAEAEKPDNNKADKGKKAHNEEDKQAANRKAKRKFPRASGALVEEDEMSSFDPDGPPSNIERPRPDPKRPLRDQFGLPLDSMELEYIGRLVEYYEDIKWMNVASRFFDETGRRVVPGQLQAKFGDSFLS